MLTGKKAIINIALAGLVLALSVGGTFAWMTSNISADPLTLRVATVRLLLGETSPVSASPVSFSSAGFEASDDLEAYISGGDDLNGAFAGWWNHYSSDGDDIFSRDPCEFAPGGLLFNKFIFENQSSIPVYFRISKADIYISAPNREELCAAVIAWKAGPRIGEEVWRFGDNGDILLVDGGDGYLYCPSPILDEKFSVVFAAYALREENDDFEGKTISFSVQSAEVIQAVNNAVYLADGWREVAETDIFEPCP